MHVIEGSCVMPDESKPVSADASNMLTDAARFGREFKEALVARRAGTPPTNLARWGEGCKPYAVASDLPSVLSNIARFGEEVDKSRTLQKRLAYARSWYAYQDDEGQWRFGPSKFVGYDRMTAEGYIDTAEDRDGRRTEVQLQQWFTTVYPESELGAQLSSALYGYLAGYGKAPSTKIRINVPNKVYATHFGATATDPHDVLVATLIAAAKTLPPSHFEKLRAQLFGRQ
jgi:hypothetical protein